MAGTITAVVSNKRENVGFVVGVNGLEQKVLYRTIDRVKNSKR